MNTNNKESEHTWNEKQLQWPSKCKKRKSRLPTKDIKNELRTVQHVKYPVLFYLFFIAAQFGCSKSNKMTTNRSMLIEFEKNKREHESIGSLCHSCNQAKIHGRSIENNKTWNARAQQHCSAAIFKVPRKGIGALRNVRNHSNSTTNCRTGRFMCCTRSNAH